MKFLITILTLLFSTTIYADPTTALNQLLNNTKTLQANFSQTILGKNSKPIQQSYGRIQLSRPGLLRWEVKQPDAQIIIANGNKLWIYDPDLQQVTLRQLTRAQSQTPALILNSNNTTLSKDFIIRNTQSKNSNWFVLSPRSSNSMFALIKLGFMNNELREMQLQDHLDNTTVIRFSNVILNSPIPASVFKLKIPPHVDVIDETKS